MTFAAAALALALLAPATLARNLYVVHSNPDGVSVINTGTNQVVGEEIKVGQLPEGIAITPDGSRAYVTNRESDSVSVIDTTTNQVVGSTIEVGDFPQGIAITPDGSRAYVTNRDSGTVSVIDTATNQVVGAAIKVGKSPIAIAITPDGSRAYVCQSPGKVSVIDTATNQVLGGEINVENVLGGIAVAPDGSRIYVTKQNEGELAVIDTATNQLVGKATPAGNTLADLAITPDGKRIFIGSLQSDAGARVGVFDLGSGQLGAQVAVGGTPRHLAMAPDGARVYVGTKEPDPPLAPGIVTIDVGTGRVIGPKIPIPGIVTGLAISGANQPPTAAFRVAATRIRPGVPVGIDAGGSKDPDGVLSAFSWAFGDGGTATLTSALATHTYAAPGSYRVGLTVTDVEGSTGQTQTRTLTVAYPGVRVACPRAAGRRGCSVKLQAVVAKPRRGRRPQAASAPARARIKPGRSAIVSLRPTARFRTKLATATTVLVKQTLLAGGKTQVSYRRLKIVQ